ncbi:TPA: SGNH/GDSL hydrolase family protein [Citrobacter freundii]|nr:SGNH/GDSL hydrolase family protein [Citrobacter freundii]
MFHVDNPSGIKTMPPVSGLYSKEPLYFTHGGNGVPPTYPGPEWFNIVQSELLNVLKESGIKPEKGNLNQLASAIKKAIAAGALLKENNGDDIPDPAKFIKNLGLNDLLLCGALVSRGRKSLTPTRIFFGADSLTEGTPDSYTQIIGGMMGAKSNQSGLLVPCRKSQLSNVSGFLEGRDAGSRGQYPRTYSLSGDALYGDNLVNATMRHLPLVTSGVQMAWKKARLYYLAQPDGGTFEFRQYSASGTKGDIVSVNTRSDSYQIQYAEIMVNPDVGQAYTEVLNGNGKLCLFLLEYINSDSDFIIFNGGQGGSSAQDWNRLNKETQRQWMNHLRFDTYIYNAGTNDRYSRTANDLKEDLTGHLRNIASADNAPHIIVVVPTQTKDYGNTHAKDYPPVYSAVAEGHGFGFISMPLSLGDYQLCNERFGMLPDGIHPSRTAHRAFGFFFASLLNMSLKNEPRPKFQAGSGPSNADPYEVDFSKWTGNGALLKSGVRTRVAAFQMGAPYIHLYVDMQIAARVNPGVFSFIERKLRVYMRSSGSTRISQSTVLINDELTRFVESGWGFTFTTEVDTSTGQLEIFAQTGRDCNIFTRVTDVRVLLGSAAAPGSALKMVNVLNLSEQGD